MKMEKKDWMKFGYKNKKLFVKIFKKKKKKSKIMEKHHRSQED